ncbi:MAG: hypothetical protein WC473_04980 [Patescibacteria group bacterium]
MKVELFVFIRKNGDGSASTFFFNTMEEANNYAEDQVERFDDDIKSSTLILDDNGKLTEIPTY